MKRKHSIFWKLVLVILPLVLLADAVILVAAYKITYDSTIDFCREDVYEAAMIAAQEFEMFNPSDIKNAEQCNPYFDSLCETMGMQYIYTETIRPDQNNKVYLSLGFGKEAPEDARTSHHSGYVANVVLDEEIRAQTKNETTFLFYNNEYGNTIICFTPVTRHLDYDQNSELASLRVIDETLSIAGAEMSIDNVVQKVHYRYLMISLPVIIASIMIVLIICFIIQKKMVRPVKMISRKMSEFVSDREEKFEPLVFKGHDELSEMAHSFNSMATEIDQYIEDISRLNREKAMQETELTIAHNIQMGFLEPTDFQNENAVIHARMTPAKDVGGDLYDYQILKDGSICIIIADVSGKGVSAALFMANAITMLRQYAEAGLSPGQIMVEYNNHLSTHNPNMMFITTFIGIYHPDTGRFIYSNAGHNPPYLLSDSLIEIESSCQPAAGILSQIDYTEMSLQLKSGDTVFLYTDGVTEAKNAGNELFEDDRLRKILSGHLHESGASIMQSVLDGISEFTVNTEQSDDITVLTLTVPEKQQTLLHLDARTENLIVINQALESLLLSEDDLAALRLMAEEIFVNICSYAYEDASGQVDVCITSDDNKISLTFSDNGKPFDPTKDVLDIDTYDMDTRIGGLGRFLTFEIADDYSYRYQDGKNILQITKNKQKESAPPSSG